ncbi:MAG: hypothetical protein MAG795_00389 [Candidatus Woesearchaeota archaeon]|nr:hypothetical protein [Candidatus Woesearchaeota archaeon]
MKCKICKKKIEKHFLKKPLGTYVKSEKGKKLIVCSNCQKQYKSKDKILAKME